MEIQKQPDTSLIESISSDTVQKKRFYNSKKFLIVITILSFCILSGYIYIVTRTEKSQQVNKSTKKITISHTPQATKHTILYETNKTKIADSLDITLDSSNQWRDVTKDSGDIDLNSAWVYDDMIKVPFKKGRFWKSDSPAPMFSLEGYYSDKLEKMGWIGPSLSIRTLEFKSFKLSGLSADSPCGGALGFLGYKDGFVRMVTLQYKLEPCQPLAMAEISPLPTDTVYSSYYMLFISEPTPIEEIAQFISNSGT